MAGDFDQLASSFARHLRVSKSKRTVETYLEAVGQLRKHLAANGIENVADIDVGHVEDFIIGLLETRAPATASNRYRALQQFFKFLVSWDAITVNPMEKMQRPAAGEPDVPSLSEEQISALLATCSGPAFEDRRDNAIIRLLLDTGMRKSELLGLTLEDLDLDHRSARVEAKRAGRGPRYRDCPFGVKTAAALDRYVYDRRRHRYGPTEWLWVHRRGRLSGSGLATMLRRRGVAAGIGPVHPHQFRHTWAEAWLDGGGNETDLMELAGWSGLDMVIRYTRSAAGKRARRAHRRLSFGDRF